MVYPTNNQGIPSTNRAFTYQAGGLNSVGEYMASGLPFSEFLTFVAGSVQQVQFPYVTSELYLKNEGAGDLFVGWTEIGVEGNNKYRLASGESVTFRIRVKDLYLSASAICTGSVTAALTQITKDQFPILTGSLASADGWAAFVTSSGNRPGFGYDGIG
jgi:hypothetical protein